MDEKKHKQASTSQKNKDNAVGVEIRLMFLQIGDNIF